MPYFFLLLILLILLFIFRNKIAGLLWNFSIGKFEVISLNAVLTQQECNKLIALAREDLQVSQVHQESGANKIDDRRQSFTAHLDSNPEFALALQRKIADRLKLDIQKFYPLQITYYQTDQEYKSHYDASLKEQSIVDRKYTIIIFLNDDFEGGMTSFPKLNLEYNPKTGDAVFFQNIFDDKVHPLSLHQGKRVKSGEKWILNQWVKS